jgi:hypothetical protein
MASEGPSDFDRRLAGWRTRGSVFGQETPDPERSLGSEVCSSLTEIF